MDGAGENEMKQLEFFEDDLKPIDYSSAIGVYSELKDVNGIDKLSDKALELLHYLYLNHARPEDGFIHADKLTKMLGYFDTRQLRSLCAEIDFETELVVYASQHGYKLASNELEIREAVRFALAPALTTIKRAMAKSKNASNAKMMQGFVGNKEKEMGGHVDGQLGMILEDGEEGYFEIKRYPSQPFVDYMPPIDERIKKHKEEMK